MVLHIDFARISGPISQSFIPNVDSDILLLCMTGHALDHAFMQHWTQNLNSRYGSFWKDVIVYDHNAIRILIQGYLILCIPTAVALSYLGGWPILYGVIISASFLIVLWRTLLARHYFSKVENSIAFNVNTQMASFFKQYPAYAMKPYGKNVPYITLSRMFVDELKATITLLCYHIPSDPALLIPTACEAIDTLRSKKQTNFFINIIAVSGDNIERMQELHVFFTTSGIRSILSIDCSLIVCSWGSRQKHDSIMNSLAEVEDTNHHLLSVYFTISPEIHENIEPSDRKHSSMHPMTPLVDRPPHSKSLRPLVEPAQRRSQKNKLTAWVARLFQKERQAICYQSFDNRQIVFIS